MPTRANGQDLMDALSKATQAARAIREAAQQTSADIADARAKESARMTAQEGLKGNLNGSNNNPG